MPLLHLTLATEVVPSGTGSRGGGGGSGSVDKGLATNHLLLLLLLLLELLQATTGGQRGPTARRPGAPRLLGRQILICQPIQRIQLLLHRVAGNGTGGSSCGGSGLRVVAVGFLHCYRVRHHLLHDKV